MGNFCVKNYEYLTKTELREYYNYLLTQDTVLTEMKINVLKNILMYLTEEENKMVRNDKECELFWAAKILGGTSGLTLLCQFHRGEAVQDGGPEGDGRRVVRHGQQGDPDLPEGDTAEFSAPGHGRADVGDARGGDCAATGSGASSTNSSLSNMFKYGPGKGGTLTRLLAV